MTYIKYILVFFSCLQLNNSFADHVSGANISYQPTNTLNKYVISVSLYRDCSGILAPGTIAVSTTNSCGLKNSIFYLPLLNSVEVSQLCPTELKNSSCNSGNLPGIQEYIYTDTIELSDTCSDWTFYYSICVRNTTENLLGSSCLYVESKLNSSQAPQNHSPTIHSQPIPYICVNSPVKYDLGIQEKDGDSLVCKLVGAKTTNNAPALYANNYSGETPISGVAINQQTGLISFTPIIAGNYVLVVEIKKYNYQGILIGSILHEFQCIVQSCGNTPPQSQTKFSNFKNFNTNAQASNGNLIEMCTGDQFCFEIIFSDLNTDDTIILSSNVSDILPNASFLQTGTNPATAEICWTYSPNHKGSIISISASDGSCPINGITNYSVKLDLPRTVNAGKDSLVNFCDTNSIINLNNFLTENSDTGGFWLNDKMINVPAIAASNTIGSGDYYYVVKNDKYFDKCLFTDTAVISIGNGNIKANWIQDSLKNLSCYGKKDGQAIIDSIKGENGPFKVIWTGLDGVFDIQTVHNNGTINHKDLYLGMWTVEIVDSIGCSWTHEFDLSEPGLINMHISGKPPTCFGSYDAQLKVESENTQGNPSFIISNFQKTQINKNGTKEILNLFAGKYYITVTDSANCQIIDSIEIINPPALEIEMSTNNLTCYNDYSGLASIDSVLNTQGNYDSLSYIWSDKDKIFSESNNKNINALSAGVYNIEVVDANGCYSQLKFIIESPDQLIGQIEIKNNTYCRTSADQNGAGKVVANTLGPNYNGSGNLNYLWTNLSSGEHSNNPVFTATEPGWMQLVIKDINNCEFIDSIYIDSLNPIAGFTINSDNLYDFENNVAMAETILILKNNSKNLFYLNAFQQQSFDWNLDNKAPEKSNWFSVNYSKEIETTYSIENEFEICLAVKNFNNCKDTICQIITITPTPELITPNVFTPGKQPNQSFFFPSKGISNFQCTIINRYGLIVYQFNDINDVWNGNHYKNNQPCSDGIYFYNYSAEFYTGLKKSGQGQVNLIRSE